MFLLEFQNIIKSIFKCLLQNKFTTKTKIALQNSYIDTLLMHPSSKNTYITSKNPQH